MRNILDNKKGLSVVVGYVLLIVISLSLSLMVYTWMKRSAIKPETTCPETISIMITNYECTTSSKEISLTLENNGLYNIDGAIIKVSTSLTKLPIYALEFIDSTDTYVEEVTESEFGFEPYLTASEAVNHRVTMKFSYDNLDPKTIAKISIIPLYDGGKERLICSDQEIQQEIQGCDSP